MDAEARDLLRGLRSGRRLSQWDLAEQLGISQRHLSYVETGRSRPSRALLIRWLHALGSSLELTNDLLVAAGHAPAHRRTALADLGPADVALRRVLAAHEPYPAFVLDPEWNVVLANDGARHLADLLEAPALAANLLSVWCDPDGMRTRLENFDEVAPLVLAKLRADAVTVPSLAPSVTALSALIGVGPRSPALGPTVTTRFRSAAGPLTFLSILSTFGWPTDITAASLRIEQLFPADEATERALHTPP